MTAATVVKMSWTQKLSQPHRLQAFAAFFRFNLATSDRMSGFGSTNGWLSVLSAAAAAAAAEYGEGRRLGEGEFQEELVFGRETNGYDLCEENVME